MKEEKMKKPYLVFLGDATELKQAKVAAGVIEWRPDLCVGQIALEGCTLDFGIPNLTLEEAYHRCGARTLIIGISPYTTTLPSHYQGFLCDAIAQGYDIGNPLHAELPSAVQQVAAEYGQTIHNFRHRSADYPKGNGLKRSGLRLLTVGTDCAIGKKFTAVSLSRSLQEMNVPSTFRSTGQTGYLISESGINNDTIQADFLSGAAEWLSPANDPFHWDLIEGQGALSHPSFAAGALSLIHGSQPDLIVMCTEPNREFQRGTTVAPISVEDEINNVLLMARRTNPNVRLGAISVFGKNQEPGYLKAYMAILHKVFNVPVFDPAAKGIAYQYFVQELADLSHAAKEQSSN